MVRVKCKNSILFKKEFINILRVYVFFHYFFPKVFMGNRFWTFINVHFEIMEKRVAKKK